MVNGICDVFDVHAERAIQTGANINRVGTDGKPGKKPQRYRTYKKLLAADDIDAVIIATPDHWHGPMTIEAAKDGIIDPGLPLYSYIPGRKNVDAVTSATEQYFVDRGLLYTCRGGKRVETTHLHVSEWINSIRTGKQPSCNIDRGFEEAMTAHMGTIAYKKNRIVFSDRDNQKIV